MRRQSGGFECNTRCYYCGDLGDGFEKQLESLDLAFHKDFVEHESGKNIIAFMTHTPLRHVCDKVTCQMKHEKWTKRWHTENKFDILQVEVDDDGLADDVWKEYGHVFKLADIQRMQLVCPHVICC